MTHVSKTFEEFARHMFEEGEQWAVSSRDEYAPHGPDTRPREQAIYEAYQEWLMFGVHRSD